MKQLASLRILTVAGAVCAAVVAFPQSSGGSNVTNPRGGPGTSGVQDSATRQYGSGASTANSGNMNNAGAMSGVSTSANPAMAGSSMSVADEFAAADADRDGRLSQREYTAFKTRGAATPENSGATNRSGEPGMGESALSGQVGRPITNGVASSDGTSAGSSSGAGSAGITQVRQFQKLDSDRDGYLSQDEYSAR